MSADRRISGPRDGFTLVELLAVVGILALLMALLTPAVFRARASAVNAKVKAEIDMLHMALMNYKSEYGSFPPANMSGLWLPSATPPQVNANHAAYKHLMRIYPRMRERLQDGPSSGPESPFKYMAQMSPAQALVFWLRGFYPNQEYPLTNGSWPPQGTRKRLFDFEEGRLYAASQYFAGNGDVVGHQTFTPRDPANTFFEYEYPVYFTAHPDSGLPYVYFDSRCYGTQPDLVYHATSRSGGKTTARPYLTSTRPTNATYAQYHVAPETFQLIASGPDASFGPDEVGRSAVAVAFPKDTTLPQGNPLNGVVTRIPSVTEKSNAPNHDDNITDFASGPLADAAATLNTR